MQDFVWLLSFKQFTVTFLGQPKMWQHFVLSAAVKSTEEMKVRFLEEIFQGSSTLFNSYQSSQHFHKAKRKVLKSDNITGDFLGTRASACSLYKYHDITLHLNCN